MSERIGGREDFLNLVRDYGDARYDEGLEADCGEPESFRESAAKTLTLIGDKLDELVALAKQSIADARLAEREACAKVAERMPNGENATENVKNIKTYSAYSIARADVAAAIRARGK